MEKLNIYCDESCHLEHDKERVMVIGGISCPASLTKQIRRDIEAIKTEYGIHPKAEIKWNKVSRCNIDYHKSLIDYYFRKSELKFRAIIVDKTQLNHTKYEQTHNDFYYKMCYYCILRIIEPSKENYIYLDKKDTKGTKKIRELKKYLSSKTEELGHGVVKRIQCVNSEEIPLVQLADLLIGAVGYENRNIEKKSAAKLELVEYIKQKSGYTLSKSTVLAEKKFNLFFIQLT